MATPTSLFIDGFGSFFLQNLQFFLTISNLRWISTYLIDEVGGAQWPHPLFIYEWILFVFFYKIFIFFKDFILESGISNITKKVGGAVWPHPLLYSLMDLLHFFCKIFNFFNDFKPKIHFYILN